MNQNEVFRSGEGDNWFLRNRAHLAETALHDRVSDMVGRAVERSPIETVCEVGCANGWRLALLQDQIGSLRRVAGSDISRKAIDAGRGQWPWLELAVGSADSPNLSGTFDLVILSFVLHWVARETLASSVAAVDALVRDGGYLIVADFLPHRPCKRHYHHRQDIELFTYKQDYRACFSGLGFYEEVEAEVFSHGGQVLPDEQDRAICALMRKSLAAYGSV